MAFLNFRSTLASLGVLTVSLAPCPAAADAPVQMTVISSLLPSCVFSTDMDFHLELQQHLLPALGSKGNDVAGKLVSGGCAGVNTVKLTFAGAAESGHPGLFAIDAGGAGGVAIEIVADDGRVLVPNGSPLSFASLPAGGAYGFKARYERVGPVTVGETKATIVIGFSYE